MGRRVALSTLAGDPVEEVPGHSAATLVRLQPGQITATPLNSRSNFGTPEELGQLGESMRVRQLQPVVVVSRAAYLQLWPEHEPHATADYVLVNGERRWRAAAQAGLPRLDALIREEIADTRTAFLDALFTENLDRRNLDPIEEARAVEAMAAECGSASAAATRFRRHESWVSQRRALLKLTPGLQARVRTGEIPVRIARSIASSPPGQQEAAWQEARTREQEQRAGRKRGQASPDETTPDAATGAGNFTAVKNPGRPPGQAGPGKSPGKRIPWSSTHDLAELIRSHLGPQEVADLIQLLS